MNAKNPFHRVKLMTFSRWLYPKIVPRINKKSDFYDMNAKNPFHRVKLMTFSRWLYPKKV